MFSPRAEYSAVAARGSQPLPGAALRIVAVRCFDAAHGPVATRKVLMGEHSHHGMEVLAVEIEQIKGRHSGQGHRYNPEHGSSFATAG